MKTGTPCHCGRVHEVLDGEPTPCPCGATLRKRPVGEVGFCVTISPAQHSKDGYVLKNGVITKR